MDDIHVYDGCIANWPPLFNSTKHELTTHVQAFKLWWHRTKRLSANYHLQILNANGYKGIANKVFNQQFIIRKEDEKGDKIASSVLSLRESQENTLYLWYWLSIDFDVDDVALPMPDWSEILACGQKNVEDEIRAFVGDFVLDLLNLIQAYEKNQIDSASEHIT